MIEMKDSLLKSGRLKAPLFLLVIAVIALVAASACGGSPAFGRTYQGQIIEVTLIEMFNVPELFTLDGEERNEIVTPSQDGNELLALRLRVNNHAATQLLMDVAAEPPELRSEDDSRYTPIGLLSSMNETVGVDLNGDGDTTDFQVTAAFYEAVYKADLNGDGDTDDAITSPTDESADVDLNGDGDTTATAVPVAFYEAVYATDINRDGDMDDAIAATLDETVSADLNGDGDSTDSGVTVAFYEAVYGVDLNEDGDAVDAITSAIDEPNDVDLNGDGDNADTGLRVAFYEAVYGTDLNGDGDTTDSIISPEIPFYFDRADQVVHIPIIRGEYELDRNFGVEGWLVFDVPKGTSSNLRSFRWGAGGDVIFIDI